MQTTQTTSSSGLYGLATVKTPSFQSPWNDPSGLGDRYKCWRKKAEERPEFNTAPQNFKEIAGPGECTTKLSRLPWELTDLRSG